MDKPETTYTLSDGDVGSYLMATIAPKHNRSDAGPLSTAYSSWQIKKNDVTVHSIVTNFQNFPSDTQQQLLPGTWVVDGYFAPECVNSSGQPLYTANSNSWTYGAGEAGSLGYYGLNQTARGARLFYVPVAGNTGDMLVRARRSHPTSRRARVSARRRSSSWRSISISTSPRRPAMACGCSG